MSGALSSQKIVKATQWADRAKETARTNLEMYEQAFHDLFDTHSNQVNDKSHYQDLRRALYERPPYKTPESQLAEWLIEDNRTPGLTKETEKTIKEIAINAFKTIRETIAEIYKKSDEVLSISATKILQQLQEGLKKIGRTEFDSRIETLIRWYDQVQGWILDPKNSGTEISEKLELLLDSQEFNQVKLEEFPSELHEVITQLQSNSLSELNKEMKNHYEQAVILTKFKQSLSRSMSNEDSSSDLTIDGVLKKFTDEVEKLKNKGVAPSEIGQLVTAAGVMSEQSQNIQGDAKTPKSRLGDFQLVRKDIPGITKIGGLKSAEKGKLHRLDEMLIQFIQKQRLEVYTVSKESLAEKIDKVLKKDSKLTDIFAKMFSSEIKSGQNPSLLYAQLFQERFGLLDLDCSSYSTTSWSQAINDLYIAGLLCRNSPIEFRPLESPSFKTCKVLVSLGIHQDDLHIFSSNKNLLATFIDPNIHNLELTHFTHSEGNNFVLTDDEFQRISDAKTKFNQLGMSRESLIPDGFSLDDFVIHLTHQIDGLKYLSNHDRKSEKTLDETKAFLGALVGQFEGFFQHDRDGNLLTDVASIFDPVQSKWIDNPNSRTIDIKANPKEWWEAKGKVSLDELSKLVQAGYLAKLEVSPKSGQVQWVFYPPTPPAPTMTTTLTEGGWNGLWSFLGYTTEA